MPRRPPRSTEERLVRAQKSMLPGTLGGRVASAAPLTVDVTRLDPRMRRRQPSPKLHTYTKTGTIAAGSGSVPLHNDTSESLTIRAVRVVVGTAPSSQDVVVNLRVDGVDAFATGSEPQVSVGATVGAPAQTTNPVWPAGTSLFVDVTQGDTAASDLHVTIAVA